MVQLFILIQILQILMCDECGIGASGEEGEEFSESRLQMKWKRLDLVLVRPCQYYKIDRFLLPQKMSENCQYNREKERDGRLADNVIFV